MILSKYEWSTSKGADLPCAEKNNETIQIACGVVYIFYRYIMPQSKIILKRV